jgi:hypothetical protein
MPEIGAEVVAREAAGGALPDVLEKIAERTDAEYNRLLAEETCPMGSSLASMSDLAIDQRLLISRECLLQRRVQLNSSLGPSPSTAYPSLSVQFNGTASKECSP